MCLVNPQSQTILYGDIEVVVNNNEDTSIVVGNTVRDREGNLYEVVKIQGFIAELSEYSPDNFTHEYVELLYQETTFKQLASLTKVDDNDFEVDLEATEEYLEQIED